MSRVRVGTPRIGGICRECEHDLEARRDGLVYCTNAKCKHFKNAHPTGQRLNIPPWVET